MSRTSPLERSLLLCELLFGMLPATLTALVAAPVALLSIPLLVPVMADGLTGFAFSAPILAGALLGPPIVAVYWIAGIARFRGRNLERSWPIVRLALITGPVLSLALVAALWEWLSPWELYTFLAPVLVGLHLLFVLSRSQPAPVLDTAVG